MTQKNMRIPSPDLIHHPLLGVRFKNLFKLFSHQGNIMPDKWPYVCAFAASALLRSPFSMIDRWIVSKEKAAKKVDPPVFILGYWRSGTTHLHNLLSCSPEFGIITPIASGIPDELLTVGTWLKPFLQEKFPEDRGIDQVDVNPQSPQVDTIPMSNLQPISIYQALYFPSNFRENFNRGVFLMVFLRLK